MKKLLSTLVCALLLLSTFSPSFSISESKDIAPSSSSPTNASVIRYEGPGFDTPEDAVLYYLAGLKNLDIEQMLGAFAWETQAARFDFRYSVIRHKGAEHDMVPSMPSSDSFLLSANVERLRGYQIESIYFALEYYFLGENHYLNTPYWMIQIKEESEADDYLKLFDPAKIQTLTGMTNIRFYSPDDLTGGKFSLPKVHASFEKMNAKYGADEVVNLIAVADIGDEVLAVAPTVGRYGNKWYLLTLDSQVNIMLGFDIYHKAFAVLPDEMKAVLLSLTPIKTAALPEEVHQDFRYEGEGFATPEEAVIFYLEGLKAGNVQQMLGAFAWETRAEHFSVKDLILWMRQVNKDLQARFPSISPSFISANCAEMRSWYGKRIYNSIFTYMLQDEPEDSLAGEVLRNYHVDMKTEEEVDAYIKSFDNPQTKRLADMQNIRTVAPEQLVGDRYHSENSQRMLDAYKKIYGADEICELVGVADLGDETLFCAPCLARYGDRWYIVATDLLTTAILNIDANHLAFAVYKSSFDDMLRETGN